MYNEPLRALSLRSDMLQLSRAVQEVVCICLGYDPSLVRLLHEIFITLLLREPYSIIFAFEADVCSLHEITR